jgi:hypothetical protein
MLSCPNLLATNKIPAARWVGNTSLHENALLPEKIRISKEEFKAPGPD